jgi:GNAT superfamily N-acetyltransferase
MEVRLADEAEIGHVARVWHDSWHDSHALLMPKELTRLRTLMSFEERLRAMLPSVRVIGPHGAPLGFCVVKSDELYQLFVSAEARGRGVAASLLADAEMKLAEGGVKTAWLACAIGNDRAARFYEKWGWHRVGTMSYDAETSAGTFALQVWRYEKALARPAGD